MSTVMDARTLQALEESIRHWEANVAAERPNEASVWGGDCALCQVFAEDDCRGCPVFQNQAEKDCFGTPYYDAHDAFHAWCGKPKSKEAKARWRESAQAELDFLISLHPDPQSLDWVQK